MSLGQAVQLLKRLKAKVGQATNQPKQWRKRRMQPARDGDRGGCVR